MKPGNSATWQDPPPVILAALGDDLKSLEAEMS